MVRVVGEVEVVADVRARLADAAPQGADPTRLVLDLQLSEAGAVSAERRWTRVRVFEKPLDKRRQFLSVDIRWDNNIVTSFDVVEVIF